MESNKPLRTHPKMTKVLLGQIDSLDKAGRSVEDIAAALNTTPEAVQRGIDKLIDRRRSEIRATPGGAFTVAAQKKTVRAVCAEQSCPWRCDAKDYCVWPTCLKRTVNLDKTVPAYPVSASTVDSDAMSDNAMPGAEPKVGPSAEANTQAPNV
jgi:hypothetical protein